jgi:tetratricopeptide (TPR) repeat protein
LANTLFITKDYKGCSDLVEKIIAKDGSKTYLRRLLAYSAYETGDYVRGLQGINDYFKMAPADKILATDYLYLGRLQIKSKGDTIAALDNIRKSIQMDSATWPIYKEIAEMQYSRKDYCGSRGSYKIYLDSLPSTEANYLADLYKMGLAQMYCREEADSIRYTKAEAIFKQVADLRPTAGIGWLWAGKAAKKLDPTGDQIQANPELANKYGRALPYWEKYIDIPTLDKEKSKKDLLEVYQYLAYCYLVKLDKPKFDNVTAKWLELETDPAQVQYIKDMQLSFGADQGSGTPGGTPAIPNGGGSKN